MALVGLGDLYRHAAGTGHRHVQARRLRGRVVLHADADHAFDRRAQRDRQRRARKGVAAVLDGLVGGQYHQAVIQLAGVIVLRRVVRRDPGLEEPLAVSEFHVIYP